MKRSSDKKIATMLAIALLGALSLSACKAQDDEEGRWIQLPGGRMVYGTPGKPETIERLIYKIDDHRYFTMMVSEDHLRECGDGTAWYHDNKRGIISEVGSLSFREEPIFAVNPGQYLAIPDPSATSLQNNARLYFSTDYGRSWKDIRFTDPRAGVIIEDDILVYLDGTAGYNEPIYIRGGYAWGFPQLIAEEKSPGEETPSANSFRYQDGKWLRITREWDLEVNRVNVDMAKLAAVSPPSGWRHLRCDPMPARSGKP